MAVSSSLKGDAALLLLASRLAEKGIVVLQPLCDSLPFDLAVYIEGKFYRLQVKRATQYKDTQLFDVPFRKVNPRTGTEVAKIYRYTEEHTDFLVGVVVVSSDFYFFPIQDTMHIKAVVRVDPFGTSLQFAGHRKLDPEIYRNVIRYGDKMISIGR